MSYSHPATFLPGGVQTGNPGASHVYVIPPASKPILNSASDQHTSGLISGPSKNGANVQRIYVRRAKITALGTPAWRMVASMLHSLNVPLEVGVSWPPDRRSP